MNHKAIYNTHPNVVSINGESGFDIEGNLVILDEAEITAEISRLQAEYDSQQYARDRAEAYPPMADQLDDIFHNGVDGWKATIQAVKDANPKPV
jgi:hypothetical protein